MTVHAPKERVDLIGRRAPSFRAGIGDRRVGGTNLVDVFPEDVPDE